MATQKMKPDLGAMERQWERQVRMARNRKHGAFALAAAIGVAALVLVADRPTDDTMTLATAPATAGPADTGAEMAARAFERFDADPATGGVSTTGTRAKTRVTIRVVEDGFRYKIMGGVVQSTRPFICAEDRTVVVFRQDGPEQDPWTDERIKTDRTSLVGDHYEWTTRHNAGSPDEDGRLYAHVSRTEFCRADTSRTLRVSIAG